MSDESTAQGPGPGEKVCPYCAEVIKAAAIKCRYCQSELPPSAPVPAELPAELPADLRSEPPAATPVEAPAAEPAGWAEGYDTLDVVPLPADDRPAGSRPDRTTLLLAGICLVLAIVLTVLLVTAGPGKTQVADNGQVTSDSFRSAAMSAAAADAATVLSYSYKTLAADEQSAHAVMTPDFVKQYDQVMAGAAPKATAGKLTLKATVLSSAIVSITEQQAKVLLFVNAVTSADGTPKQALNQNRVLVTLTRKDGDWLVSKMDAF